MANEIRTALDAEQNFTLTLVALGGSGSARQSTMVSNATERPAMLVYLRIRSGAVAPTAGSVYEVYLLRGDGNGSPYRTDGAGASDAAITIENAQLMGTIVVTANTSKYFYGDFDTAPLGPLGTEFGIAIRNNTGQVPSAVEADHYKRYTLYLPEIQ